jgi:hypothetical protein
MGRRGVVWDRQGEEGTELGGLYKEKGWEGRKGREGRKEGGDCLVSQRKFLDPPLCITHQVCIMEVYETVLIF